MISTFYLSPEMDEGPVLLMQRYRLWERVRGGKKASDMYQEIAKIGGRLLATTLFNIRGQKAERQGEPSYSHEPSEKDLTVNWKEHTGRHILNMLAAGGRIYTTYNGKKIIIEGLQWGKKFNHYLGTAGQIMFEGRRYDKPLVVTHDNMLLGITLARVPSVGLTHDNFKTYVAANHRMGHKNLLY
jgi:methionyl-tRNA formyltransferase